MKNLPLRTIDTEKVKIIREWARHSSEKAESTRVPQFTRKRLKTGKQYNGLNMVAQQHNESRPKTGD